MPLHDHFHGLLGTSRSWTAFSSAWATYTAEALNDTLPEGYFAEPCAQFGIEIDVAAWQGRGSSPPEQLAGSWTPTPPQATLPLVLVTDEVTVRVFRSEGGPVLAAAIEFVSPGNKDRPAERDAFVSKCAAYLQQGVGLIVVDVVTTRRADLHGPLLTRVAQPPAEQREELFAASYRPVQKDDQPALEIWYQPVEVGGPLPTLPLGLRRGPCLPVDFEATYEHTCRKMRLTANGVGQAGTAS
jgi:hypothetical protein